MALSVTVAKFQRQNHPELLRFFARFCIKTRQLFLDIVALAMGARYFRLGLKFLDREKNDKLLIAVLAEILISRHKILLIFL
jgi:hypothetical protein